MRPGNSLNNTFLRNEIATWNTGYNKICATEWISAFSISFTFNTFHLVFSWRWIKTISLINLKYRCGKDYSKVTCDLNKSCCAMGEFPVGLAIQKHFKRGIGMKLMELRHLKVHLHYTIHCSLILNQNLLPFLITQKPTKILTQIREVSGAKLSSADFQKVASVEIAGPLWNNQNIMNQV